jgi:hypothetical protein
MSHIDQICFQAPPERREGSGLVREICQVLKTAATPFVKVKRDARATDRVVVHAKEALPPQAEVRLQRLGLTR